jgi:hypothetical protein
MELEVVGESQFSVQQILEAGRRAEAGGNREHAHQFFTHILTHHASAPEAAAALEGVRRLEDNGRGFTPDLAQANIAPQPRLMSPGAVPTGRQARGIVDHNQHPPSQTPSRRKKSALNSVSPRNQHTYRLGRVLSRILAGAALLGLIASLTALGANVATMFVRPPGAILTTLATSPAIAAGLLGLSAVILLLAQMARATFDAAASLAAQRASAE